MGCIPSICIAIAGDTLEPGVFNPLRTIHFDPTDGGEAAALQRVLEAVHQLETNESARRIFFAQPALLPTADAWINAWCDNATALMRDALHRKGHRVLSNA